MRWTNPRTIAGWLLRGALLITLVFGALMMRPERVGAYNAYTYFGGGCYTGPGWCTAVFSPAGGSDSWDCWRFEVHFTNGHRTFDDGCGYRGQKREPLWFPAGYVFSHAYIYTYDGLQYSWLEWSA